MIETIKLKKYFDKHDIHTHIWQHAYREAPDESCGLIIDDEYIPCDNVADDPQHSFRIPDKVMMKAYEKGDSFQAVVHSHVDEPHASLEDMKNQYEMGIPWGIAFINGMQKGELHFWGDSLEIQEFENRPFVHGIYDCYSLVFDYYRKEFSIVLPHVPRECHWWDRKINLLEDNFPKDKFREVDNKKKIRRGDVLLFKLQSQKYNHCGIYVGNEQMLHHVLNRLSSKSSIYPWLYHATVIRHNWT